jgi:LCP family protein required for cell wall assembly
MRRPPAGKPTPTKVQSAVEVSLFAVFGISILVATIGLVAIYSPSHRQVPNRVAAGLAAGRVNIVVIGMTKVPPPEGDGKEMMTDSVTLLSLKPSTRQLAMISIPHDLWLRLGRFGMHRLGSADSVGESSGYPGEGPALTMDTIQTMTAQPVHAFLRTDESGIKAAVDALGGVDVLVQNNFYEWRSHRRFKPGLRHLDGEHALLFASPFVGGPQGKRFACEVRQQQLLAAIIDKLRRSSPDVREKAAAALPAGGVTDTNLTRADIDQLCAAASGPASVRYVTLQPFLDTIQVQSFNESEGEAVIPHGGDFNSIKALAHDVFGGPGAVAFQPLQPPPPPAMASLAH